MSKVWKHDELAADLAAHLATPERMVWEDLQLGPSGSPRPDVFTMQKSYSRPLPQAYEIKISVADFRSDVTSGKWQKYLRFAGSVTFAVPAGLIGKDDVPPQCGLMVRSENGWRTIRKSVPKRVEIPWETMQKLLIDGVARAAQAEQIKVRSSYLDSRRLRKSLGEDVALCVADLERARFLVGSIEDERRQKMLRANEDAKRLRDRAEMEAQEIRQAAQDGLALLAKTLGLDDGATAYQVRRAIEAAIKRTSADARVAAAERAVEDARATLERAITGLDLRARA